jgi:chromosome segregation ATPase
LHSNIDGIQDKIKDLKEQQEKDIVRKFSTDLNKLKAEIENSKSSKGMSKEELKDRENQLNQHLEVITNIAQRIENENRTLMKKNSELKKDYQNQENDRELLLKQLVMLKKENGKIKEEIDYYGMIIEEKKEAGKHLFLNEFILLNRR